MIDAKITFEQIPYVIADLARQVALLRDELKSKKEDINNYMSVDEVASYLKLGKSTIYKKTSEKTIPHIKEGKKLYFLKSDINNYLNACKV